MILGGGGVTSNGNYWYIHQMFEEIESVLSLETGETRGLCKVHKIKTDTNKLTKELFDIQ